MGMTATLLGMDGRRGPHSGMPLLKQAVLDELKKDTDISNVKVVVL